MTYTQVNVSNVDVNWRYMVGFGMIPPFLILLALLFIPESPRWLILNGYNTAAKSVLELVSVELIGGPVSFFEKTQVAYIYTDEPIRS